MSVLEAGERADRQHSAAVMPLICAALGTAHAGIADARRHMTPVLFDAAANWLGTCLRKNRKIFTWHDVHGWDLIPESHPRPYLLDTKQEELLADRDFVGSKHEWDLHQFCLRLPTRGEDEEA